MHIGDSAVITFVGTRIDIYGVTGPNGGVASAALDGQYLGNVNFRSPLKHVRARVFTVTGLTAMAHSFALVVSGSKREHHRAYVNIDYAEIRP
jgi:hypothetical protein